MEGMRMVVKVEKPDTYDGDKSQVGYLVVPSS